MASEEPVAAGEEEAEFAGALEAEETEAEAAAPEGEPGAEEAGEEGGDPFARIDQLMAGSTAPAARAPDDAEAISRIATMMEQSAPEPIPEVFATAGTRERAEQPARTGGVGLWVLLAVLVLGSAAAALYYFQARVIDAVPAAARLYDRLGLRQQVVGWGLVFRDVNSERMSQGNSEMLVVRGFIANTTGQLRTIPLVRLALFDGRSLLQEKIIDPPQPTLAKRASVAFRIMLSQPDAHASRFELTFAEPKPGKTHPTPAAKGSPGAVGHPPPSGSAPPAAPAAPAVAPSPAKGDSK